MLDFANSTFDKADKLDRAGRRDKTTVDLYFSAWDFFKVVEQHLKSEGKDLTEKKKYAMWRATEMHRAMKEGREAVPPPSAFDGVEEELEAMLKMDNHVPETSSQVQRVGLRNFHLSQSVLFTPDGHTKMMATITGISNDHNGRTLYKIRCVDGSQHSVESENLAPQVEVGDALEMNDEIVQVEEIYASQWPPKYLVKTQGRGLREVHDEELAFPLIAPQEPAEEGHEGEKHGGDDIYDSLLTHQSDEFVEEEKKPGSTSFVVESKQADQEPSEEFAPWPGTGIDLNQESSDDDIVQRDLSNQNQENSECMPSRKEDKAVEEPTRHLQKNKGVPHPGQNPTFVPYDYAQETNPQPAPRRNEDSVTEQQTSAREVANRNPRYQSMPHGVPYHVLPGAQYAHDPREMLAAEKAVKSALSAISFEDVPSAVTLLVDALNILTKQK